MSTTLARGASRTWHRPPFISNPLLRWGLWLAAGLYLAAAIGSIEVNWSRVWEGLPRAHDFVAAFFPPISPRAGTRSRKASWKASG